MLRPGRLFSRRIFDPLALVALCSSVFLTGPAFSADYQIRFGEIVRISPEGRLAMSPDLAVDQQGRVHVLWVDKGADGKAPVPESDPSKIESAPGVQHHAFDDLYYRQLDMRSATPLGEPVRVNSEPGEVWGFSVSKPQISVGPDGLPHVMFTGNQSLGEDKSSVIARYTRSTDGGQSFEPVRTLNSPAENDLSATMHGGFVAAHAFGTLLATDNGDVGVYWIDTRLMSEEDTAGAVFAALSKDGGETFATDGIIFEDNVCPCCQLAAAEGDDKIYLSSRRVFENTYRDAAIAVSGNSGKSFGNRIPVGEGRWEIQGCPLKRIDVATSNDTIFTASYTQGADPAGVYLSRSTDGGKSYESAVAIHPDARVADAPALSADSNSHVWLVWHAKTTGKRRVFLQVSADAGDTWSSPIEVPAPDGTATFPEVEAAADGTAYVTWQQQNTVYLITATVGAGQQPQAAAR